MIWQGGVQEVLLLNPTKPQELVLYLKKRKGFIKLALTTGSPVVPVFAFNLDGSYGYWVPRGPFAEKISRVIGIAPLIFWGRWGLPFGIPNPQKAHIVIGQGMRRMSTHSHCLIMKRWPNPIKPRIFPAAAIDVPKEGDNASQESVDKWHNVFLEELELLFERHKYEAGYGDRHLKFI